MKPTRIIRAPYRVESLDVMGRKRHKIMIDTDSGTHEFYALAELIGVHSSTFRTRLHRDGWKSPHVLNPPTDRGKKLSGDPLCNLDQGNDEWRLMGNRPRNYNLYRIDCGRFEK